MLNSFLKLVYAEYSYHSYQYTNDVRYNENAARTYTLREEKWSSMSLIHSVGENNKIIATDIQQLVALI